MPHTYTKLLYHVVYSTRQRRLSLQGDWVEEMKAYTGGILRKHGGALLAMNGPDDHMHLLISLPPALALADLIREVKRSSSVWIQEHSVGEARFRWQEGYAAFTVGSSSEHAVKSYINGQAEHHHNRSFEEELRDLLDRAAVAYDAEFFLR